MVASGNAGARLFDFLKPPVAAIQDFYVLSGRAIRNLFRGPHYADDIAIQMDVIGVGSLPIVILIGFFSGFVITMQMSRALAQYGATDQVGQIVAITLVRELGPVLTALLVAGRNASGIASELGSMKVTEQIDAMRALGTDPMKKLVTPRILATVVMLFLLTIVSDTLGTAGGAVVAVFISHQDGTQYFTSAYQALGYDDIAQGLTKPLFFGFIIATVGCYFGMKTTGGTQGVGRATTQAVVVSSVLIVFCDFILSRALLWLYSGI